jgi:hypothetical protein
LYYPFENMILHSTIKRSLTALLMIFLTGCVTFARPAPMMTFGGSQTTAKGTSDAGLALGVGAALYRDGHSGGQGWLGRYRYGLGKKWDIGIDAMGISHSDY